MKSIANYSAAAALIVVGILYANYLSFYNATIATQNNCVAATAKAEGYPGNVHGPEAYDLFISKCR